ncbi:rhamnogalacturonan lyase [Pontibacter beigongshangensis]|uniref:rhamnogalacturonan lyase n=1 Tax=Pontibacter beigongshangensis TaxID=2574733 RepID=UPI00164FC083|nr:rhamnogalacturonan lyase [Pontibacter beigongshangensis]
MLKTRLLPHLLLLLCLLLGSLGSSAQRVMENLGRGVVAVPQQGSVYVSWRLLGTDRDEIAFNLYRSTGAGKPVKLNKKPIATTTDFTDTSADLTQPNAYVVRPVLKGKEQPASKAFIVQANPALQPYLAIPLQVPAGGEIGGRKFSYYANDASAADLDGDGEYEIILKWEPSNARNPPQTGLTGNQLLDAYKLDGTLLWRIDLGKNIRSGAAYTQFLVYDFDGDGKAELICKTADGTIDGTGHSIGNKEKDWRTHTPDSRLYGKVAGGPEYLTVFDGKTGAALATASYVPDRYPLDGWGGIGGNGGNDSTASRADRFSACVAYLDGSLPSAVMIRGWYGRTVAAAWDWRDGKLTQRWVFDTALPEWQAYSGMANHSVTVADFDDDGKDEICVGAMTIDHDGKGLFSTGLRHGDALHAGDLLPSRPGLEVFGIHESEGKTIPLQTPGSAMFDGRTGELIWANNPGVDVGRGMAADIDPNYPGAESWGAPGGTRRADTGEIIYPETPNSTNFAAWWDADPLRELVDQTQITKWDWQTRSTQTLLEATGAAANNGSKATPCLTADLLGDWREEIIWRSADNSELRIYSSTIPATNRLYTLMHDPQYRLAIAWQNVAYNQPPHPGFFIGAGMQKPPRPNIVFPKRKASGAAAAEGREGRFH